MTFFSVEHDGVTLYRAPSFARCKRFIEKISLMNQDKAFDVEVLDCFRWTDAGKGIRISLKEVK